MWNNIIQIKRINQIVTIVTPWIELIYYRGGFWIR